MAYIWPWLLVWEGAGQHEAFLAFNVGTYFPIPVANLKVAFHLGQQFLRGEIYMGLLDQIHNPQQFSANPRLRESLF
jgi:hypothetical protein